jgi:hypothetical protein
MTVQCHHGANCRMGNSTTATFLDALLDLCYPAEGGTVDSAATSCTCSDVDRTAYSARVSCTYSTECRDVASPCEDNDEIVNVCFEMTYEVRVTAPYTSRARSCYEVTTPFLLTYCYESRSYVGSGYVDPYTSCDINIDGVSCNYCYSTSITDDYGYTNYCTILDCSNTPLQSLAGQHYGTFCDEGLIDAVIAAHVANRSFPCSNGCNLCGAGGHMTDQGANWITAGSTYTSTCYETQYHALSGGFSGTPYCSTLMASIKDVCGCVGGETPVESEATPAAPSSVCAICDDGNEMTTPDANVTIPTQNGNFSCSQLQQYGDSGEITPDDFLILQSVNSRWMWMPSDGR